MSSYQRNLNDFNNKVNELRNMELEDPNFSDIKDIFNAIVEALDEYEANLAGDVEYMISKIEEDENTIFELESKIEELEEA